jgi:hypothetical protein
MADLNDFPFAEKVLIINNVKDYREVQRYADEAVKKGWLSKYFIAEEYSDEALTFFGLSRKALGKGYAFSIGELVSIYLCRTEFLLHFTGDCIPAERCAWVPKAIRVLTEDERVKVANLLWDRNSVEAKSESSEETDDFFKGFGFSDQCYFIRVQDFRKPIYNYSHPASARYPDYCGELFEKRVDSWMRCRGYLRATYKHASYLHQNLPLTFGRRIQLLKKRAAQSIAWRINRLKSKIT